MSSITSYNELTENLLKLHKCYRVQMLLPNDVISRVDLLTKPHSCLVLAVTIWAVDMMRRNVLSYSDIIYIHRRLAQFILQANKSDIEFLKRMLNLMPSELGEDVNVVARRCMIDHRKLMDIIRILNFIKEVITLIESDQHINEPIRRIRTLCLYDVNFLPPMHANSKIYIQFVINALSNTPEIQKEPLLAQSLELIETKLTQGDVNESDLAAITLVSLAIARHLQPTIICVEPCIELETFVKKIYTDLMDIGADPSKSNIYQIYQELSTKSVFRKLH